MTYAPPSGTSASDGPALLIRDLVKRYGELTAVAGISLRVEVGEIFGLLGPNGAGKTTTLEMIEGIRRPDGGEALVMGVDAVRHPRRVREIIGVQLQEAGFFERLTVKETLSTFAAFHRRTRPINELLDALNLNEKANAQVATLSGGQRQRLSIALALLNDPQVVFLDEPTTGLDPQARRNLWDVIARIRDEGRTVVLTTHSMDEAEHLCDRVAIVDHGRLIALDRPAALIAQHAPGAKIRVQVGDPHGLTEAARGLAGVERADDAGADVVIHSTNPKETLPALFDWLRASDMDFGGILIEDGTLEDVFINLTGRRLRE